MILVYVHWNVITHMSKVSVSPIFPIFSFSPCIVQVSPTSFTFSFIKNCHKFSDVPSNVFVIVSLLFYPELSRMVFCGHGYEPHGLYTRLTVRGPRG